MEFRLGISGRMRSGKDTFANFIVECCNTKDIFPKILRLAEPIYSEAKIFYDKHGLKWRKNRRLLEGMGEAFNQDYPDGDKLIEIFDKKYQDSSFKSFICPDIRRIQQAKWFTDHNIPIVRINCGEDIRKDRCNSGEFEEGHISDIELDNYNFDYYVNNVGSLKDLNDRAKEIFNNIIKGLI